MIRTILIEDEYPAAERLSKMLAKADPDIHIISTLDSVQAATDWFLREAPPDLVFADIQLSDGLSFEIFEQVTVRSPVIFTTSYDEYAIKAFKVKSIDYLLKPIKAQELQQAIAKFRDMRQSFAPNEQALRLDSALEQLGPELKKHKNRFLVRHADQLIPVPCSDIAYFYTTNELVCLVRQDAKQFLMDYTLEQLEELLPPDQFFRLNRQFIAAVSAIHRIHTHLNGKLKLELLPAAQSEILVSREKAKVFLNWLEH